jgi:hypothetical protein
MARVLTNSYSKQSSHQEAYNPATKAAAPTRNTHRLQNIAKIKAKHRQKKRADFSTPQLKNCQRALPTTNLSKTRIRPKNQPRKA